MVKAFSGLRTQKKLRAFLNNVWAYKNLPKITQKIMSKVEREKIIDTPLSKEARALKKGM